MFYLLNKKKGESSFQAIKKFARANSISKIGHTGTLDPLASGLLLIATDYDTKLIPYLNNEDKTYEVEIEFGKQTDTYDAEGKIINSSDKLVNQKDLTKIQEWFIKQNCQIPPIYSAKKINGQRSYDLARQNKSVELKPQKIKVYDAKILDFDEKQQILKASLKVSKGTYIRSLVNDLGVFLGTFAYMKNLKRTAISNLDISLLNGWDFAKINITHIIGLPIFVPTNKEFNEIKNGKKIKVFNHTNGEHILEFQNTILGIVSIENNQLTVKKLFGNKLKEININ